MRCVLKWMWILVLILWMFILGGISSDINELRSRFVRIEIISNSYTIPDLQQARVTAEGLANSFSDMEKADLVQIQDYAKRYLLSACVGEDTSVCADVGHYKKTDWEKFSVPSGKYCCVTVAMGAAAGPKVTDYVYLPLGSLACVDSFQKLSFESNASDGLVKTLFAYDIFPIRFIILDQIGKLEKIFV